MIAVAVVVMLGQAAFIAAVVYFARSFGSYTSALLDAQESNVMIRNHLVQVAENLGQQREEFAEQMHQLRNKGVA